MPAAIPPADRYHRLFEDSPVSLWDEDFSKVAESFARLREEGVDDFRNYFEQHPEVVRELQGCVQILDVNRATLDLHGARTKEELLAGLSKIFVDESFETFTEELIALADGATEFEADAVIRTLAGEKRNMHLHLTVPPGAEESLSRVLVSCQDISDRKRNEELRRFSDERKNYEQSARTISALAGGIAHDLNNLLVGILGNVALASSDLPRESPIQSRLAAVTTGANRAATLANEMLAISGTGTFVTNPISLNEIVVEAGRLLCKTTPSLDLSFDLASGQPIVLGDGSLLKQVLVNLLTNAVEAQSERTQRVEVATRIQPGKTFELPAACSTQHLDPGPYVLTTVNDIGCGIDEQDSLHVFDPFFSTKGPGRGLGLASVAGIIHGHRGAVWISSLAGEGTQVSMLLPISKERQPTKRESEGPANGWILIVDDEPSIRKVARSCLQRAGYQVETACDGEEALEIFERAPEQFDAVLLDVIMPGICGQEVFAKMRSLRPDVQVLLSSGCLKEDAMGKEGLPGLAGFLQKPYELKALLQEIGAIVAAQHG